MNNRETGIVSNCINNGTLYGGEMNVPINGGIVYSNRGQVYNCINTGSVEGHRIGDIVYGNREGGIVDGCINIGSIYFLALMLIMFQSMALLI